MDDRVSTRPSGPRGPNPGCMFLKLTTALPPSTSTERPGTSSGRARRGRCARRDSGGGSRGPSSTPPNGRCTKPSRRSRTTGPSQRTEELLTEHHEVVRMTTSATTIDSDIRFNAAFHIFQGYGQGEVDDVIDERTRCRPRR